MSGVLQKGFAVTKDCGKKVSESRLFSDPSALGPGGAVPDPALPDPALPDPASHSARPSPALRNPFE